MVEFNSLSRLGLLYFQLLVVYLLTHFDEGAYYHHYYYYVPCTGLPPPPLLRSHLPRCRGGPAARLADCNASKNASGNDDEFVPWVLIQYLGLAINRETFVGITELALRPAIQNYN